MRLAIPERAKSSNGVTVVFKIRNESRHVLITPGVLQEIVHDFSRGGPELQVDILSNGPATQDWVYLLDGWIVPIADSLQDLSGNASQAEWKTGEGNLRFGVNAGSRGEASFRKEQTLLDGIAYGPEVLFTHPNWENNGFIEATWPWVDIPDSGAVVRAIVGFHAGRKNVDSGVSVTVKAAGLNKTETLIEDAVLMYYAESAYPAENNASMLLELSLPLDFWESRVRIRIRVDALDGAGQDWVCWPYLKLTPV